MNSTYPSFFRPLTLLLTFITGLSALVYEVTWHRYLANFIGSEARAAAIILAVFLGGLSLGYWIFGLVSRGKSSATLVKTCGLIEIIIGAWAFLFPKIYGLAWKTVGALSYDASFALIQDCLLCFALIGLPTILMGGTLPLLTQGLSRTLEDSSPFHAKIYAVNTLGACFGCLMAGFILLPNLGLPLSMMVTASANLFAGLVLFLIGARLADLPEIIKEPATNVKLSTPNKPFGLTRASSVALLAGFYAISLQTILIRLTGLSMGSSEYSFAMVVGTFVLLLAVGAWLSGLSIFEKYPLWLNQVLVCFGLLVIYFHAPLWPYFSHVLRVLFAPTWPGFFVYHGLLFAILCAVLFVPLAAMGATLPMLFKVTRDQRSTLGSNVGYLYAWNTLGCVLGAVCGGHLLLYWFDLDSILIFCVLTALISLALVVRVRTQNATPRLVTAIVLAVLGLGIGFLLKPWNKINFAVGTFRYRQVVDQSFSGPTKFYRMVHQGRTPIAYKDDPNTTVAVVQHSIPADEIAADGISYSRSIYVNGKSDGATRGKDLRTTRLLAHLPALLGTGTESSAAIIGFGTGITAGSLSLHPRFSRIDTIEISSFIKKFAPLFDFANQNVSRNPHVHWISGDAYRVLAAGTSKYSIIISEPSNPWVTGVERLYTQDFLKMASSRLEPKGIYTQWFHSYEMQPDTVALVYNTFSSVFPHVRVFPLGADLILIGSLEPIGKPSLNLLNARLADPKLQAELAALGIGSVDQLLEFEVAVPKGVFSNSGIHTLEFPKLSFRAGRDFFIGSTSELPEIILGYQLAQELEPKVEPRLIDLWKQGKQP